jgi:ribosomal protein S27E
VRRWACPTCAGLTVGRPHPFATVTCPACGGAGRVLAADEAGGTAGTDAHPTGGAADLAENNLARTDRVQLPLPLDVDDAGTGA